MFAPKAQNIFGHKFSLLHLTKKQSRILKPITWETDADFGEPVLLLQAVREQTSPPCCPFDAMNAFLVLQYLIKYRINKLLNIKVLLLFSK